MAEGEEFLPDASADGQVDELISELVQREVAQDDELPDHAPTSVERGSQKALLPATERTAEGSSQPEANLQNSDAVLEMDSANGVREKEGLVHAETLEEGVNKHKTKEQELVMSEEVVARMERIDQRSKMELPSEEDLRRDQPEAAVLLDDEEEEPRYYDPSILDTPPWASDLPSSSGRLVCSFGMDSSKRGATEYIEEDILLFPAANTLQTLNVKTMVQSRLQVAVGQGVSTVAIHPSRRWFAVCERGVNPSVLIYIYPSLQLYKILRGGTERSFGCAVFSADGRELATVGGYPDYWLTVWDWRHEAIKLRAKAFSQDVFKVCFSPYFPGQLTTSGTGHIRFWRMAATFTGLKLQGLLGKFGAVPLSDISGFVELPDGKVLSGTESGTLLLWDGGFIKCEITRPGGVTCHAGSVECVQLERKKRQLITAGFDGYVRVWDLDALDAADQADDKSTFEMTPLEEILIGEGVRCKALLREADHWLVQDERGAVLRVALPTYRAARLLESHSGAITGLATHPGEHVVATAGEDATVRLYSYSEGVQKQLVCRAFSRAARCCQWAPDGRTLLVGFADGILRVLARTSDTWKLVQAIKPHTAAVTCLATSDDGQHLATGSEDGTVFFLNATEMTWAPVGYFVTSGPVSCVAWQSDAQRLLVGCRSGQIMEVTRPAGDEDTSKTLALALPSTTFSFAAALQAAAEKAAREAAAARAAQKQAEENGDESRPEEEPDTAPALQITPEEPPPVNCILRHETDPSLLYASFESEKHRGLFACHVSNGVIVEHRLPETKLQLRAPNLARSARFLAAGSEEGVVRVQPWGAHAPVSGPGWQACAHDSACAAARSFDDAFLISGGATGVLLVHRLLLEGITEQEGTHEELAAASGADAGDITSESAYSLEDAKQREEADKLRAEAARRQMSVKEQLAEIRRELKEEIERNRRLPTEQQVPPDEMVVDPGLKDLMSAEVESHVALAHRQLEWETQKATVALDKLRKHFLEPLETERIVVDALSSNCHVSTFQTLRLSADVLADIATLKAREHLQRQGSQILSPGVRRRTRDILGSPSTPSNANSPSPGLNTPGEIKPQESRIASKQAVRKKQREAREQQWALFNKTRPDPAYENPTDLAAIQAGWDTLGDFKLKSDPDYIVPEAQRIDAEIKRAQILQLTEAMHTHKCGFNAKVLELRARKEAARRALEADAGRVCTINKLLGLEDPPLFVWRVNPKERPEAREDVSERELAEFRQQQKQAAKDAKTKGGSGLGGFGGSAPAATQADGEDVLSPGPINGPEPDASVRAAASGKENAIEKQRRGKAYRKSELEIAEQEVARRRLRHEKGTLVAKVQGVIRDFDSRVGELRVEKLALTAKLKAAEGRMLVLQKELDLLKEFEKKDILLTSKSAAKKAEQQELESKTDELESKLETKQAEIAAVAAAKGEVLAEFDRLIEPGNVHREALVKVYNRKIKRIKKKETNRGSNEDDESEEEESEDEDMDDDEEGDTCPVGCERAAYEAVCQLREKKLDHDDVAAEVTKVIEGLKREHDALTKKLKLVEGALKAVEKEMEDFQKEKQGALNQIDVAVTLSLHQIQHLSTDNRLPEDLSSSLVFTNAGLARLRVRVGELGDEKAALARAQRDLHKEHSALQKQKREKERKIADLKQRAVDVQMLKFGQVIDLKLLEAVGDSQGADELRAALAEQERIHAHELGEWKRAIDRATDVLADATAENTACLNRAADFGEQHQWLEQGLAASQHSVLADAAAMRRKETEERDKMVQVVNAQVAEVERLKAEIQSLKSKGSTKPRT